MPNKDTVVAVISDMQVGGTTALAPPKWNLAEGGTYHASPAQMILYRQWINSAKVTKDLLNETKRRKRLVLILNGEPIDNFHHETNQVITQHGQEQTEMAVSLLDEWMQIVDYQPKRNDVMYLVRGSTAHERGEYINTLGRDLDGVVPLRRDTSEITKDGRYYFQKLRRTVNGKMFHIAHHGFSKGSRAWTSENSISYTLKSMYMNALDMGYDIPDFVIRSHNHVFTQAWYHGRRKSMFGCITPCWQLKTHFGNQVAANDDINTIGMINFDIMESGASKVIPEILEIEDTKVEVF